jgi:hypothetical protein
MFMIMFMIVLMLLVMIVSDLFQLHTAFGALAGLVAFDVALLHGANISRFMLMLF